MQWQAQHSGSEFVPRGTRQLHVATADVPSQQQTRDLAGVSALEIRYRLVRPHEIEKLAREYLPPAA